MFVVFVGSIMLFVATAVLYASFVSWADHGGSVGATRVLGFVALIMALGVAAGLHFLPSSTPSILSFLSLLVSVPSAVMVGITFLPSFLTKP